MKRVITFIMIMVSILLISGCGSSEIKSYDRIEYDGVEYFHCLDISLAFSDASDLASGIERVCEKIGRYEKSDIYIIEGLDQAKWLYFENQGMIGQTGPDGLYRAFDVKMDELADFNPAYIKIVKINYDSLDLAYESNDWSIVTEVANAINNGQEVQRNQGLDGDEYYLYFRSEMFPNLEYVLLYFDDSNGEHFIRKEGIFAGFMHDDASIPYKIDNTIHDILMNN